MLQQFFIPTHALLKGPGLICLLSTGTWTRPFVTVLSYCVHDILSFFVIVFSVLSINKRKKNGHITNIDSVLQGSPSDKATISAMKKVVPHEGDFLEVFYYHSAFEICPRTRNKVILAPRNAQNPEFYTIKCIRGPRWHPDPTWFFCHLFKILPTIMFIPLDRQVLGIQISWEINDNG